MLLQLAFQSINNMASVEARNHIGSSMANIFLKRTSYLYNPSHIKYYFTHHKRMDKLRAWIKSGKWTIHPQVARSNVDRVGIQNHKFYPLKQLANSFNQTPDIEIKVLSQ